MQGVGGSKPLDRILAGRVSRAVFEELAGIAGHVAVFDWPRLARLLTDGGLECTSIVGPPTAVRGAAEHWAQCPEIQRPPFSTRAVHAVVMVDPTADHAMAEALGFLIPGGRVILLTREDPRDVSGRALCAGLVNLTQCAVGRRTMTAASKPAS